MHHRHTLLLILLASCTKPGGPTVSDTHDTDSDGDGFADVGDCDPDDPEVHPGASEQPYNGVDDDCDPESPDDDLDGDGQRAAETGGEDCDDENATVFSGADEICGDGVINDCDSSGEDSYRTCWENVELSDADARIIGENDEDYLGVGIAAAGDMNGDGNQDLLVGSPFSREHPNGVAYLVSGPFDGDHDIAGGEGFVTIMGETRGGDAGGALDGGQDINGDGVPDLLVGAPSESTPAVDAGATYVQYGPLTDDLGLAHASVRIRGDAHARLGYDVALTRDTDGDGRSEVLVGAPGFRIGGRDAGAAFLFAELDSEELTLADATAQFWGNSELTGLGTQVVGHADLNSDGLADVLLCSPGDDREGGRQGQVMLFEGPSAGVIQGADADATLLSEERDTIVRVDVAAPGDLDHDGHHDLAFIVVERDLSSSSILLLRGPFAGTAVAEDVANASIGEAASGSASPIVELVGDVNGDGFQDIVSGNPAHEVQGEWAGAATLLLGPFEGRLDAPLDGMTLVGGATNNWLGADVAGLGDLDGDGLADFAVADRFAGRDDDPYLKPGIVYLFFGMGM